MTAGGELDGGGKRGRRCARRRRRQEASSAAARDRAETRQQVQKAEPCRHMMSHAEGGDSRWFVLAGEFRRAPQADGGRRWNRVGVSASGDMQQKPAVAKG
ncbi:hypothetical protein OsJ_31867 [Oryza sativa Japonica Group]|uniref:Uncharacterized protein n=1 Tax=Oryza sativa subsp. japonica TaxID=39947 RepID=B9G677_ORYSJ|nr:hypothetical protein OsJ_31867 [Oryza sativa Japonica Group]